MHTQERPFLQARSPLASNNDWTLEEERREVVVSVLGALAGTEADPDEMAACSYLLKHLSQTVRQAGPRAD